jgi:hypothetical protein
MSPVGVTGVVSERTHCALGYTTGVHKLPRRAALLGALFAAVGCGTLLSSAETSTGPDASADAAASVTDAPYSPADAPSSPDGDANSGPGGPGGPRPKLLVSDPADNRVDLVTTTGTILASYTSPAGNVAGVAFDRRSRDGFWVIGSDSTDAIYKVPWSGAASALTVKAAQPLLGNNRGLDYFVGETPAQDLLVVVHTNPNGWEEALGLSTQGSLASTGNFIYQSQYQTGFWGVSFLDSTAGRLHGWYTRGGNAVEEWDLPLFKGRTELGVAGARGVARTPAGEFWVVDVTTNRVEHLSTTGAKLDGFTAPGKSAAGLSYDPGP